MQARRNINRWQELMDEQRKSGLSKAKFCLQKGLNASRFYYCQAQLKKSSESKLLLPIQIKNQEIVKEETHRYEIRFILKNQLECILPIDLNNKRMREIVEVLIAC